MQEDQAAFTTRDVAREFSHFRGASAFYHLNSCGDALPKIGRAAGLELDYADAFECVSAAPANAAAASRFLKSFGIFPPPSLLAEPSLCHFACCQSIDGNPKQTWKFSASEG